jgi:hypothetical protein
MTMRQARLAGFEKCTVDMTSYKTAKTYTQNCYYDYSTYTLIWNDVVATLEDDDITTEKGTRYYMTDFQNGHANLRPASTLDRYEYITSTNDTVTKFRSNVEAAQYHYFNENGAYKRHARMTDTLMQAVDANLINSGWLLAHDGSYEYKLIAKAATAKRAETHTVSFAINCFNDDTNDAYTKLAEVLLGKRDRAGRYIEIGLRDENASQEI